MERRENDFVSGGLSSLANRKTCVLAGVNYTVLRLGQDDKLDCDDALEVVAQFSETADDE